MFEFERATTMDMLYHAWQKISAKNGCAGVDGVDLSFYRSDLRNNLRTLQTAAVAGDYRPYAEKRYNRKDREICVHCVDDKIMQTAVAEVVSTAYTPPMCVHGFIKNRSIYSAKKSLDHAVRGGIVDYCKVDISRFYDSIDTDLRRCQTSILPILIKISSNDRYSTRVMSTTCSYRQPMPYRLHPINYLNWGLL